jgi:hypothetical protein
VDSQDPVAIAAVRAIRTGDTASLASLLSQHPGLVSEQIHGTRTPLHVAADWPGYFPTGPATVRLLIEAGRRIDRHPARQRRRIRLLERRPSPRAAWRPGQQALARRRPGPHAAGRGIPRCLPGPVTRRHHRGLLASVPRRAAADRRAPAGQRGRSARHPRLQRPDGRPDRCRAWCSAREPRDLAARPFAVTTASRPGNLTGTRNVGGDLGYRGVAGVSASRSWLAVGAGPRCPCSPR